MASAIREIHDLIYGIPELPKFNLGRQLKLIWSTEIPDRKTEKNLFRDLHPVNFTVCDDKSIWVFLTAGQTDLSLKMTIPQNDVS